MNIPDHISECEILKFFGADPGICLTLDPGGKKFGFGVNLLDP
jgi:hypothetical protein